MKNLINFVLKSQMCMSELSVSWKPISPVWNLLTVNIFLLVVVLFWFSTLQCYFY